MNDELKEIAARLQRIHEGDDSAAVYGQAADVRNYYDPYVKDLRLALGDWLSQMDETPDADWLRSIAVTFNTIAENAGRTRPWNLIFECEERRGQGATRFVVPAEAVPSRGAVLRLLAALSQSTTLNV
jgi:hypothetical protein